MTCSIVFYCCSFQQIDQDLLGRPLQNSQVTTIVLQGDVIWSWFCCTVDRVLIVALDRSIIVVFLHFLVINLIISCLSSYLSLCLSMIVYQQRSNACVQQLLALWLASCLLYGWVLMWSSLPAHCYCCCCCCCCLVMSSVGGTWESNVINAGADSVKSSAETLAVWRDSD